MWVLLLYVPIILGVGFFFWAMVGSFRTEAPYVPTGRKDTGAILKIAQMRPGEVFFDLGSGDGRFVRAAARLGARAIGIEQSWTLVAWSKMVWWLTPGARSQGSALFIRGNFLKRDLRDADIIFCYLMPKAMEKLKPKFERELRPGTRILSRAFKVPGWVPGERLMFGKRGPPVYRYTKS